MRQHIPQAVIDALTSSREVGGRLTFRDNHAQFFPHSYTGGRMNYAVHAHDSCVVGGGILRAAAVEVMHMVLALAWQYIPDPSAAVYPAWVLTDTYVMMDYPVSVGNGVIMYTDEDSNLCFRIFDPATNTLGPEQTYLSPPNYYAAGAITSTGTRVMMNQAIDASGNVTARLGVDNRGFLDWSFSRLYGGAGLKRFLAAELIYPILYATYQEDNGRSMLVEYNFNNGEWSLPYPVVPLDVIDEDSSFTVLGLSVVDGQLLVAGRLRRASLNMDTYMFGPKRFTFGREMYVRPNVFEERLDVSGPVMPDLRIHKIGATLWAVGFDEAGSTSIGEIWKAEATNYFGGAPATTTTTAFNNISLMCELNRSNRATFLLKPGLTIPQLKAGAEVDVDVALNGNYARLGTFSVDGIQRDQLVSGDRLVLQARSLALKTMAQWKSDSSYDYWSQAKATSLAKELTRLVRTSGQWAEAGDYLKLTDLNQGGVLYATAMAARNGIMRARFKIPAGDYFPSFGVGINYYYESKPEAAARLGKTTDEVQEGEYGHSGLFALVRKEADGRYAAGVQYMLGGTLTNLHGFTYISGYDNGFPNFDPTKEHWLEIVHREGEIWLQHRAEDETHWGQLVVMETFDLPGKMPWLHERRGRGAIYVMNGTPHSDTAGVDSTYPLIPVKDNSVFPASDTVIIDTEHITYSGKSPNYNPANNAALGGMQIMLPTIAYHGNSGGGVNTKFGQDRAHQYMLQTFQDNFHLDTAYNADSVSITLGKVGDPKDGVAISIRKMDRSASNPLGTEIASAVIPASELGTSANMINVQLNTKAYLESGNKYSLCIGRTIWIPNSDEAYKAYAAANHYVVVLGDGSAPYPLPCESFSDDTDKMTALSGDMEFWVYGWPAVNRQINVFYGPNEANPTSSMYNDEMLVVTEGKGLGTSFKITRYDPGYMGGQMRRFYVLEDPGGLIDQTSRLAMYPTLKVVKRGADGTIPAPHAMGSMVSVYRDLSAQIKTAEYFSGEMDLRFADMFAEIAAKAGIRTVDVQKIVPSGSIQVNPGSNQLFYTANRVNGILRMRCPGILDGLSYGVYLRGTLDEDGSVTGGYRMMFTGREIQLQQFAYGAWSTLEWEDTGRWNPSDMWLTFSVWKNFAAFWMGDRLIRAFIVPDAPFSPAIQGLALGAIAIAVDNATGVTQRLDVDWSELDQRVDNYILDMGKDAASLMDGLISSRKMYFIDDEHGNLKVFRSKTLVSEVPYELSVAHGETVSDVGTVSRLRVEGVEIIETCDPSTLAEYGNVFELYNSRDSDNRGEMYGESAIFFDEMNSYKKRVTLTGAADPRIEPGDIIRVKIPNPVTKVVTVKDVIVDTIGFNLSQTDSDATFDMTIEGRYA